MKRDLIEEKNDYFFRFCRIERRQERDAQQMEERRAAAEVR
jgi:hypothetical protein